MDKEALNKVANEAIELWLREDYERAEPLFQQTLPYIGDNHWRSVDYLSYFACNQNSLGKIDEAMALFERSLNSRFQPARRSGLEWRPLTQNARSDIQLRD